MRLRSHSTALATALAVGLSAGLSACAGAPPPASPEPGPRRETAALTAGQIAAVADILRLEDHRAFDEARLRTYAGYPSLEVRRRAVTAAGRIGDPSAAATLVEALASDPAPAVRADAAFALGVLGDTSRAVIDGLAAVGAGGWVPESGERVPVVVEALTALGNLDVAAADALILRALEESAGGVEASVASAAQASERHVAVAAAALLSVWKITDGAAAVAAAAPFLAAENPEVRWRAAYALMRGGEAGAVPHLLRHGADEDHRVRAHKARALASTRTRPVGATEEALGWLVAATEDAHPHVRINAIRSLATYGPEAALGAVEVRVRDTDASVAHAAASALGALGSPAVTTLEEVVASPDRPLPVRGAALEQWARVAPAEAAPRVADWAERQHGDDAPSMRYYAARAAAALPPMHGVPVLRRLLADADPRVAVAAAVAARQPLGDERLDADRREALLGALRNELSSPSLAVPAAVLRTYAPHTTASDLDPLVVGFQRFGAMTGARILARSVAMGALEGLQGLIERAVVTPEDVAARLGAGAPPEDRWLHRAAAELVPAWRPAPDPVASDDPAFYQGIVQRRVAPVVAGASRPRVRFERPDGSTFLVELLPEEAPLTVHTFLTLTEAGYYEDGVWHRVIPNFVLQDGAPAGAPDGGPGWTIRDEINRVRYDRGSVGMALSGPDTGGSQWFIAHSPQPHLDGGYTVFGRVVDDMAAADGVLQGEWLPAVRVIDGATP